MSNDSPEDRERVKQKIGGLILRFYELHREKPVFHGTELYNFIIAQAHVAPSSAERILRQMRKDGLLDYVVIDRSAGEYAFCYQD